MAAGWADGLFVSAIFIHHLSLCAAQSSSPSYLLMASLDAARALADVSEACFGEALRAAQVRTNKQVLSVS